MQTPSQPGDRLVLFTLVAEPRNAKAERIEARGGKKETKEKEGDES